MKQTILILSLLLVSITLSGQSLQEEMKQHKQLYGSNYLAYPGPKSDPLTPQPAGYRVFYLSHYGRHGSRFQIGSDSYTRPYSVLLKARQYGKLTPKGLATLQKVKRLMDNAYLREGELTPLGALQHRQIAQRMYEHYPEVFQGKANIDAKSTVVIRCILSMENALQQLVSLNPQLQIRHDASYHDMVYMNHDDTLLNHLKWSKPVREAYERFCDRHLHCNHLMNTLFNDASYWRDSVRTRQLYRDLYELAGDIQGTELRDSFALWDIFTTDELYQHWLVANAFWYSAYGPNKLNGGTQPYSQRFLLRKIITEADSCIALPHPGATLRYGHDTMVYPLTCLLGLDGKDQPVDSLEDLVKAGWRDYDLVPMAANLQFVFYRRYVGDKDVLVKVLRNENEATLPFPSDCAPYYHWRDFKAYYLKKLAAYERR